MIAESPRVVLLASAHPVAAGPEFDGRLAFGFLSTFLSIVLYFYRLESRSSMRLFAFSLAAVATDGLIAHSWSQALIAGAWSVTAFMESAEWTRTKASYSPVLIPRRLFSPAVYAGGSPARMSSESRISRMFGPTG